MSDELLYRYVKGQGWIVGPPVLCSPEYVLRDGRKARYEMREPVTGEWFSSSVFNSNVWWDSTLNQPFWDSWTRYVRAQNELIQYNGDDSDLGNWDFHVVLVIVE